MQNAECRMQNDLTTLRSVHKERIKRGTRSAEYGTTLFECGVRNAERSSLRSKPDE